MLSDEETARRIKAARLMLGMEQTELAALLVEDGFGKHDAGRLERAEMTLTAGRRAAVARHLRVPERFFLAPHDRLFAAEIDAYERRLVALETELTQRIVAEAERAAEQALRSARQRPPENPEATENIG